MRFRASCRPPVWLSQQRRCCPADPDARPRPRCSLIGDSAQHARTHVRPPGLLLCLPSSPQKHQLLPDLQRFSRAAVFLIRAVKTDAVRPHVSSRARAGWLAGVRQSGLRDFSLECLQLCFKFHIRTEGRSGAEVAKADERRRYATPPQSPRFSITSAASHLAVSSRDGGSHRGQEKAKKMRARRCLLRVTLGPRRKRAQTRPRKSTDASGQETQVSVDTLLLTEAPM